MRICLCLKTKFRCVYSEKEISDFGVTVISCLEDKFIRTPANTQLAPRSKPLPEMFCISSLRGFLAVHDVPQPKSLRNQAFHPLPKCLCVFAASRNRRRNRSSKPEKKVRQCISFVASNLKVLPPAFDLLFGGSGGGSDFWKGFGWEGGSDWNRRKKLGFEAILISVLVSVMIALREPEKREWGIRVCFCVTSLLGTLNKGWIPGFCCFGVLVAVVWGMKLEDVERFIHKFAGLKIPVMGVKRRRRTLI